MPATNADRNLLFAVLTLQADFLDAARFAEICTAWAARKDTPIADLLVEKGWISREDRKHLDYILERKLRKHGGDAQATLSGIATPEVHDALNAIADPEVRHTLSGLPPAGGRVLVSTIGYQHESRDRYTMSRLHATGGIGQVWLAHDTDLDRDVALKELRPERAEDQSVWARFLEEAKITGQLEHPGIVPVYELARPGAGRQPYYTMRFVKGRTLTKASRAYHASREKGEAGPLDLRELLGAFIGVCNAIAYAHSRGVIHRDLKGSNVVLGEFGEVIVLDWGLAKVLDRDEAAADAPPVKLGPGSDRGETVNGQVLGTPGYMAPEQAEGRLDLIGYRTDVYGLGAILYEILTGQAPFPGDDSGDVLAQVLAGPPVPPRAVVGTTPRALQAVCLKALAKKPADRYASAGDLALEVRHYLADEPVTACREPAGTRLARWGRRHKPLVAGAAALLVAAVAALSVGTVLLGRANAAIEAERRAADRQRAVAQANYEQARKAVDDYLVRVSETTLLNSRVPGLQPLRKELLTTALPYYQDFAAKHADDPALRADLARTYSRIGRIIGVTGSPADAVRSLEQSRDLWRALADENPNDLAARAELARTYRQIATHQRTLTGTSAEGAKTLATAREMLEDLVKRDAGNRDFQNDLADCYLSTGSWLHDSNRFDEELPYYQKAIAIWEGLVREDPKYQSSLAAALIGLGFYHTRTGKWQVALGYHERARDILEKLLKENPNDLESLLSLRRAYTNIGYLHHAQSGNLVEAVKGFEQARKITDVYGPQYPTVREFQDQRAGAYYQLGEVLISASDPIRAVPFLRRAVQIYDDLVKLDADNAGYVMSLGDALRLYGKAVGATRAGFPDAAASFTRARDLLRALTQKKPDYTEGAAALGRVYRDFGLVYLANDRKAEAGAAFRDAVAVLEPLVRDKRSNQYIESDLATAYTELGNFQRAAGQLPEAEVAYRKVWDLRRGPADKNPDNLRYQLRKAQAGLHLGETLAAAKKPADARAMLAAVRATLEPLNGSAFQDSHSLAAAAAILVTVTDGDAAREALAKQAIAGLQKAIAEEHYRGVAALKQSVYYESLRGRADFQDLVADLESRVKFERDELLWMNRALALLRKGDHAAAVAEAKAKGESKYATDVTVYNAACIYALASDKVWTGVGPPSPDQEKLAQQDRDRSLALLRQSLEKGYRDLDHIKSDEDLRALHGLAEFKALMSEWEGKAAPRGAKRK
jgi:serine/threonine-protein kinase